MTKSSYLWDILRMMQNGYRLLIAFATVLLVFNSAQAQSTFTYKPGNSINWTSEDESAQFRILGYIRATANTHEHFDDANPGNQFFVRRARKAVSQSFTFFEK